MTRAAATLCTFKLFASNPVLSSSSIALVVCTLLNNIVDDDDDDNDDRIFLGDPLPRRHKYSENCYRQLSWQQMDKSLIFFS